MCMCVCFWRWYWQLSIVGLVVIHVVQATVKAPARYPHIHDYLFAAYSCGHFLLALAYATYWQWTSSEAPVQVASNNPNKSNKKTNKMKAQ